MSAQRRVMPNRRAGENFELPWRGTTIFKVTVGYYEDEVTVGEVFITGAKVGSDFDGVARDGAILMSLALQFGCPIDTMRGALTRDQDGTPSTIIGAVADKLAADLVEAQS